MNQMQLTAHMLGFGSLPVDTMSPKDKKFITGMKIDVVVASEQAIAESIEKYYTSTVSFDEVMIDFVEEDEEFEFEDESEEDINVLDLQKSAGDAPVVKLVNLILLDANSIGQRYFLAKPLNKLP